MSNDELIEIAVAIRERNYSGREQNGFVGICDVCSKEIACRLDELGLPVRLVGGTFSTDKDLPEDRCFNGNRRLATHVWVEVHTRILDATASQFCQFVTTRFPLRQGVFLGDYADMPQYVADERHPWTDRDFSVRRRSNRL